MKKLFTFCFLTFTLFSSINVLGQNSFIREFNTVHHMNSSNEDTTIRTEVRIIFNAGSSNNVIINFKEKRDINLFQTTIVEDGEDEFGEYQEVGYAEVNGDGDYYLILYEDGAVILKSRDGKFAFMFVNE